ncbi:HDOD domain-containing protein [Desulfolutivibrio sulfoxidireducens]|uniref:HDOD domain-containing protein n=1 Tax=Desulfolutivibrio sulfoxidireducens TaxID=2773299 RepID=UPI00159DC7E3|nr:HDOD domain-containing protein [Desulfolutivibrio sulfoxidireducens]QLA19152.1 HDOD domain-containing protein [Desulfolutivibrio sulfoxidireducens]
MSRIAIDAIKPGMIAASDIQSPDGRIILPAGQKMEPWHLKLLAGLGLEAIEIEDPAADASRLEEAAEYTRDFFAFLDPDHPVILALFRHVAGAVAQDLAQGKVLPSLDERRAINVEHLSDVMPMEIAAPARLAAHETELASFPDVYFRLKEEMDSPRSSVTRITGLIGRDVNLSAKLLRLANSPFYNFSGTVETIERAVALIGMEQITTLALGVTAINYFKGIPHELVDMRSFWRHAVSCGLLAKLLASVAGVNNAERYFVEGLLHDVGRLILFKKMPYASTDALLYARENRVPMVEAERATFAYIHTDVSHPLLRHWSFPAGMCDAINHHHDPLEAENPRQAAVIHMADLFANAMEIASGNLYVLPPFEPAAWERVGIAPQRLPDLFSDFAAQAGQTLSVFA